MTYGAISPVWNPTLIKGGEWWHGVQAVTNTVLPLDALSALPAAAYSLRLLTKTYTGPAINVRRDSDNAAMDIGFVGNRLDTATLLAFVGSGSGFVTAWYNQGTLGSAANVIQPTANQQPGIVSSGALYVFNGGPSIYASGSYKLYSPSVTLLGSGGVWTANSVYNATGIDHQIASQAGSLDQFELLGSAASLFPYARMFNSSGSAYSLGGSSSANIVTAVCAGTPMVLYANGTSVASGTQTSAVAPSAGAITLGVSGCVRIFMERLYL